MTTLSMLQNTGRLFGRVIIRYSLKVIRIKEPDYEIAMYIDAAKSK